ncbi:MAG: hypothetical protein Q8O64_05730 [Sideroxyarcus sp.]|nr:hypothetical protein [Sideroxyarcus sp.]
MLQIKEDFVVNGNVVTPEDFDRMQNIAAMMEKVTNEWAELSCGARSVIAAKFSLESVAAIAGRDCAAEVVEYWAKAGNAAPVDLWPFTVIAIVGDSGQIIVEFVMAKDSLHAFRVCAEVREDADSLDFVACVDGHISEDAGLYFPGNSVVDCDTVLIDEVFDGESTHSTEVPKP